MKYMLMVCAVVALLAVGMHQARENPPPGSRPNAVSLAPDVIVDVPLMRMEAIPTRSWPMSAQPAVYWKEDAEDIGDVARAKWTPYKNGIDRARRGSRMMKNMDGAHRARDASI